MKFNKKNSNREKTRVENLCVYKMTQMMQSMRWLLLECYKFNALLILLTLISHDRFSMVFGITVNPLESLVSSSSSYGSDEYSDTGDGPNEFDAEVHDLNNIDISQFTTGYAKFADSEETVSITNNTGLIIPLPQYDSETKPSYLLYNRLKKCPFEM